MLHHGKLLIPLFAVLLAAVATAPVHAELPDATIQQIIDNRLDKRDLDEMIEVGVVDGVVTLTGSVETLAQKSQAEKLARKTDDVVEVDNRVEVVARQVSDSSLAREVSSRIRTSAYFDIFDWVEGRVEDGVVILEGSVREAWKKQAFTNQVENIAGVRAVDNRLEIQPASLADDQIRVTLAREIYGDLLFQHYATGALRAIHIVVDGGQVRLEGVVNNQVEKRAAGNIARSEVLAFSVTNNLKVERQG